MKAIPEHRTQTRGSLGRRAQATAVVACALALAPQWAAAQDSEEMQPAPEEETLQPAPETVPPEESTQAVQPEPETPDNVNAAEDTWAYEGTEDTEYTEGTEGTKATEPKTEKKMEGIGASVSAAGGVSEFSRSEARDFVNTGGAWDLRGVFGTRTLVGLEAAYIGTANGIDAPGESSQTLFGNGLELSGRLNILRNGLTSAARGLQPYLLAGVAWKNYQVDGDLQTAAIDDSDNAFEVPVGTGLGYYFNNGVLLDARFAYRFAFSDSLIEPVDADAASLDNWSVTGRIGAEF